MYSHTREVSITLAALSALTDSAHPAATGRHANITRFAVALHVVAARTGRTHDLGLSVREVAELMGVGVVTAHRWLERARTTYHLVTAARAYNRFTGTAAVYTINPPHLWTVPGHDGTAVGHTTTGNASITCPTAVPSSPEALDEYLAQIDVFGHTGLGPSAKAVHDAALRLTESGETVLTLDTLTGAVPQHRRTVIRAARRLAEHGELVAVEGGWELPPRDVTGFIPLALRLGVLGRSQARRKAHSVVRDLWAKFCEAIRARKRRRVTVGCDERGRVYDLLTGELLGDAAQEPPPVPDALPDAPPDDGWGEAMAA